MKEDKFAPPCFVLRQQLEFSAAQAFVRPSAASSRRGCHCSWGARSLLSPAAWFARGFVFCWRQQIWLVGNSHATALGRDFQVVHLHRGTGREGCFWAWQFPSQGWCCWWNCNIWSPSPGARGPISLESWGGFSHCDQQGKAESKRGDSPRAMFLGGAAAPREGTEVGPFSWGGGVSAAPQGPQGPPVALADACPGERRSLIPRVSTAGRTGDGSVSRVQGAPLGSFIQSLLLLSPTAQNLMQNNWPAFHQAPMQNQ